MSNAELENVPHDPPASASTFLLPIARAREHSSDGCWPSPRPTGLVFIDQRTKPNSRDLAAGFAIHTCALTSGKRILGPNGKLKRTLNPSRRTFKTHYREF